MPLADLRPLHERVWDRVSPEPNSGCWMWLGSTAGPMGYGQIQKSTALTDKRENVYTHRVMYERYKGAIPPNMTIDHKCRNVLCCNPDHLEVVTRGENVLRGNSLSGLNKRKTHCKRGHPLEGTNLIINSRGERQCRICVDLRLKNFHTNNPEYRNEYARQYRARKKSGIDL